jgi:hypothetical protein
LTVPKLLSEVCTVNLEVLILLIEKKEELEFCCID